MGLLTEIWMRGCCRTVNMTCWSLPRSISDRGPKGKGETKTECAHAVIVLIRKHNVLPEKNSNPAVGHN